jgi:hypothetical protein
VKQYGATVVSVRTQEDLQAMIEAVNRQGFSGPPRATEHPCCEGFPEGIAVMWFYVGRREYAIDVRGGLDLTPLRTVLHRLHELDLPLVERLLADNAAARSARDS